MRWHPQSCLSQSHSRLLNDSWVKWAELNLKQTKKRSSKKLCKKWEHLTRKKISALKNRWQLVPCSKARALASPGIKQRAPESWTQCMDYSLTQRSDFQTICRLGLRAAGHTRLAPGLRGRFLWILASLLTIPLFFLGEWFSFSGLTLFTVGERIAIPVWQVSQD